MSSKLKQHISRPLNIISVYNSEFYYFSKTNPRIGFLMMCRKLQKSQVTTIVRILTLEGQNTRKETDAVHTV